MPKGSLVNSIFYKSGILISLHGFIHANWASNLANPWATLSFDFPQPMMPSLGAARSNSSNLLQPLFIITTWGQRDCHHIHKDQQTADILAGPFLAEKLRQYSKALDLHPLDLLSLRGIVENTSSSYSILELEGTY